MKKLIVLFICLTVFGCASTKYPRNAPYAGTYEHHEKIGLAFNKIESLKLPVYDFRYTVLENNIPNMWVIPSDKEVKVTTGFLDLFTVDETAVVLLHENAHIELNHTGKRKTASIMTSVIFIAGSVFVPGIGYLNSAVNPLVTNAFSRPQELDADKEAIKLGVQAGITPEVYVGALEKLRDHPSAKDNKGGGIFDSHPNLEYRIEQATLHLQKSSIATHVKKAESPKTIGDTNFYLMNIFIP